MPMRFIFFLAILLQFCSCTTRPDQPVANAAKDSLLTKYLAAMDAVPDYDTTDINYRVLKAYQHNDTAYIQNLTARIQNGKQFDPSPIQYDSCLHQQPLPALGADEAYRFILFPPFCSTPIQVTLTKTGDSANLHFLLYNIGYDTVPCQILSEFDKKLTPEQWNDIHQELWLADIWGLKRENGEHGRDGSNIWFWAYQKPNPSYNNPGRSCYIKRWGTSTLRNVVDLALKLSGNKQGCFWIEDLRIK